MTNRFAAALAALALAASAGAAAKAATAQEERNLQIAIDFYNAALNEKEWDKARTYMGDRYVQHSIYTIDGHEGLRQLVERIKENFPENHGEILQGFADGDMVVLHLHVTRSPTHAGWSVVELMRLENEKVVEHWDIFQAVPETSVNSSPLF